MSSLVGCTNVRKPMCRIGAPRKVDWIVYGLLLSGIRRIGGYSLQTIKYCEICGKPFEIIQNGWTRKYCYDCAPHENENCSHADAVTTKRRALKKMLIEYKGGKCERCGYNKCMRALEFHHLNPSEKDFGLSKCLTKSVAALKAEADKCILLCANCHAEIHQELYEQGYNQFKSDI